MIYLFNRHFKVFTMEQLIQCRIRDMKFKNKVSIQWVRATRRQLHKY